eukprot:gene11063-11218_t
MAAAVQQAELLMAQAMRQAVLVARLVLMLATLVTLRRQGQLPQQQAAAEGPDASLDSEDGDDGDQASTVLLSKHDLTCRGTTLKAISSFRQLQQDPAQAAAAGGSAAHAGAVFNTAAREKAHEVETGEEVTSRWHLGPDVHPEDILMTQLRW